MSGATVRGRIRIPEVAKYSPDAGFAPNYRTTVTAIVALVASELAFAISRSVFAVPSSVLAALRRSILRRWTLHRVGDALERRDEPHREVERPPEEIRQKEPDHHQHAEKRSSGDEETVQHDEDREKGERSGDRRRRSARALRSGFI